MKIPWQHDNRWSRNVDTRFESIVKYQLKLSWIKCLSIKKSYDESRGRDKDLGGEMKLSIFPQKIIS